MYSVYAGEASMNFDHHPTIQFIYPSMQYWKLLLQTLYLVVHPVDGSEIRRSPVEGTVVYPHCLPGFFVHPNGGWPWDFWTINRPQIISFSLMISIHSCWRSWSVELVRNCSGFSHPLGLDLGNFRWKLTCQLSFPRKTHLGGFNVFLMFNPNLEEMTQFWRALVFSIGLKRPTSNISPMKIDAWKMLHFLSHGPFSGDIPQFFGGGETSSLHTATLENKMIWAGEQHHFKMWNFIILKPVLDRSLRPEELLWINQTWDVWFFLLRADPPSTCFVTTLVAIFFKMSFLASSLEFWWFFWDWENKWLFGILLKNSNPSHMK